MENFISCAVYEHEIGNLKFEYYETKDTEFTDTRERRCQKRSSHRWSSKKGVPKTHRETTVSESLFY